MTITKRVSMIFEQKIELVEAEPEVKPEPESEEEEESSEV